MNGKDRPKIGLVLGGGGARGLAHIGVLKQFVRNGIPIDLLAGASMGGFVAAAFAAGVSALELDTVAVRMARISRLMRLVNLSGPRRGLIESSRLHAYLCDLVGKDTTIEGLPIPLALTAVDLISGQLVALRQGSLANAIQATMAVPGLFSPVPWGEARLADGGLLNNVPVDAVRAMGAGFTIAVDVSPSLPVNLPDRGQAAEAEWPAWFPAFARDFYVAELIMISALTEIRLREARPELIIRPALPAGISIFWGFHRAAEAITAGEVAVLQAMPELEKLLKS